MSLASAQNVTIGDYSIGIDEEATVPITVLDAENVAGGVVKVTFDPAVVSAEEVVAGDFSAFMPLIDNSDGWVKLVAANANAMNKNEAVLARIVFKGATAGATDIRVEYASLNDADGGLLTSELSNGSIEVHPVSDKPPCSIQNLKVKEKEDTWINWTWTNPDDEDFNHTIVYLDGRFAENTSNSYYKATGLLPGTIHTIGTRTVDSRDNVNTTWVNNTAKTTGELSGGLNLSINDPIKYSVYTTGDKVNFNVRVMDSEGNPLASGITAYVELSGSYTNETEKIVRHIPLSEYSGLFVGEYLISEDDPDGSWTARVIAYSDSYGGEASIKLFFADVYVIEPESDYPSYVIGDTANFRAVVFKPVIPPQPYDDSNMSVVLSFYPLENQPLEMEPLSMVYNSSSELFEAGVDTNLLGYGQFAAVFFGNDSLGNVRTANMTFSVSDDFFVDVNTDKPYYDRKEPVSIIGTVKYTGGTPLQDTEVDLVLDIDGFKRSYSTVTDEAGEFNYTFQPFSTEAGNYSVTATAEHFGLSRRAETNFNIYGLYLNPQSVTMEMVEDSTRTFDYVLYNLGNSELSGISAYIQDFDDTDSVNAEIVSIVPSELLPGQNTQLTIQFNAGNPVPESALFELEVSSDQTSDSARLQIDLFAPVPVIEFQPEKIELGLSPNETALRTVTIANTGYGVLENLTLHQPEKSWMYVPSDTQLGDLEPGEQVSFDVLIHSYGVIPGTYYDSLGITAANHAELKVNLTAHVTELEQGSLLFHIRDALERDLPNASVSLFNKDTYEEFEGATNASGYVLLEDLPVGNYIYEVSSEGTYTFPQMGELEVEPMGVSKLVDVYLYMDLIDFDWEVNPTSIEDYYNVTLKLRFETDVPVPLLLAFPPSIEYNMLPGEVRSGSFTVYNVGLVSVYNVSISPLEYRGMKLEPLVTTVDEIKGKSHVQIPYKVTVPEDILNGQKLAGNIFVKGRYVHFVNDREVIGYIGTGIPVLIRTPIAAGDIPDYPDFPGICFNFDGIKFGAQHEKLSINPNVIWIEKGLSLKDLDDFVSVEPETIQDALVATNYNQVGNIVLSPAVGATSKVGINQILAPQIPLGFNILEEATGIPGVSAVWGDFVPYNIAPGEEAYLDLTSLEPGVGVSMPSLIGGGILFAFGNENAYNCFWFVPIAGYDLSMPYPGKFNLDIHFPPFHGDYPPFYWECGPLPPVRFIRPRFPCGTTFVPWHWSGSGNWPDWPDDPHVHPKPRPERMETIHEVVELSISQNVTMERDAFWAGLGIKNKMLDQSIEDVKVNINIEGSDGPANDKFFIRSPKLKGISNVDGAGIISPAQLATSEWLIIPEAGAGGSDPEGSKYNISANISYIVGGVNFEVETNEIEITVKPQPEIVLDYFIPSDVIGNKPFKLAVQVTNEGYGEARDFAIETAQPVIYYNPSGLLLDFEIIRSQLQGKERSTSMKVDFGDIQPGESKLAWWDMVTSLDGTFTKFTGEFTHSSELGGMETSLIKGINTYIIQKELGTEEIGYDFLVNSESDENYYLLFNSSTGSSTFVHNASYEVVNVPTPTNPVLDVSIEDYTGEWVIVSIEDPYDNTVTIEKVVRKSDGTEIPSYNYWMRGGRILIVDHYDEGFDGAYQIIYSGNQGVSDLQPFFIDAYNRNGGLNVLGIPATGIYNAWGYWVQDFNGASGYPGGKIMYNPYKNCAYYIHGAIWERYNNLGGPNAKTDEGFELGPPTSDIKPYMHTQDPEVSSHGTEFRYQNFEGGALDQNLNSGVVYEVHGAIYKKWKQLGAASSDMGLPITDEKEVDVSTSIFTGRYSEFEGGIIVWNREMNDVWVIGLKQPDAKKILDKYYSEGGSNGWLGFPVSNDYINPSGHLQCDFEGGYITTADGVIYEAFEYADQEPPTLSINTPENGESAESYRIVVSGSALDENGMYCIMVNRNPIAYYNTNAWNTNVELQAGENKITVTAIDKYYNSVTKEITVYYYPDFSFVHITDVHIGCDPRSLYQKKAAEELKESKIRFTKTLDAIGDLNQKPAILLISGDLVEWNHESFLWNFRTIIECYKSQEKMKGHDTSVYCIPGNHDRRKWDLLEDDNLVNYHKYITSGPNIKDEDRFGPDDFTFEHDGYLFIGLDSGEDWSSIGEYPFTPEGSGLYDIQIIKLEGMVQNIPKIIFMHHPVINEGDDQYGTLDLVVPDPKVENGCPEYGGNDECISTYRYDFINYCTDYNVQLVLTGHTHKSYEASVLNTRFIQTPSATKDKDGYPHGYRIIEVKNGKTIVHQYEPTDLIQNEPTNAIIDIDPTSADDTTQLTLTQDENGNIVSIPTHSSLPFYIDENGNIASTLDCPAHLHVYDSKGGHTGLNASGDSEINISDSFYIGRFNYSDPNEPEIILLYNTTEDYRFEIVANLTEEEKNSPEIESFNFTVEQERGNMRTTISYLNVPLTENTIATLPINLTTTAYTMKIDYDGDGATDESRNPDFTEINYAPTAAIIFPKPGSIYNESEVIEFNGTGRDPEDGILTNFSLVWYSDVNGVIGAGERFSTANLSTGMHMITLMVNDSVDLVDTESVRINVVDRTPPSTITNLQHIPGTTWINWTWTKPQDFDFNHTEIYLNGTFQTITSAEYFNATGLEPETSYTIGIRTVDIYGNVNETWVNATATTGSLPDSALPMIESVILLPTSTTPGSTINVTVNVTDNVGVIGVKANDITLFNQDGSLWNGSITAIKGAHSVNVSAVDEAGNVAWDNSTAYTALTPDNLPPSSITSLQSIADNTWINWTWQNPTDPNFNHTEIYLNNIFQTNTSTKYFNATGLQPETDYTIGTRTVDIYGNVNETWVNLTATTGAELALDVEPPVFESFVLFPANTTAGATIDIEVNATDNVGVTEVTAGDTWLTEVDGVWQGSITAPSSVGDYSLLIKASDAAGNTAETSVPYHVVLVEGGADITVSPRASSVVAGNNVSVGIKVKNTQNVDDIFNIRINLDGVPESYWADLSGFGWTETDVKLRAGEERTFPLEVEVSAGTSAGYRLFKANVDSETSAVYGFDTGYLIVS
ncbi:MAG: metallophosphoesterase [Methanosarcinaceae archaeon]